MHAVFTALLFLGLVIAAECELLTVASNKILLKQQNLDKLDAIFWDVSDPKSTNYGKYLTQSEIAALVAPEKDAFLRVFEWLDAAGINKHSVRLFPDFMQVTTTVLSASNLFSTDFARYISTKTGNTRVRITREAKIPSELASYIDFVVGISELIDDSRKTPRHSKIGAPAPNDQFITPSILKAYYGIPSNFTGSNITTQGIAAFMDYFSLGALKAFDTFYNIPIANVTRLGPDCFGDPCDQYESDLDIQYITSMAVGIPTIFLTHPSGEWVLDWAQQVNTMPNPPLVNSISYGWPELEQCDLAETCGALGYNSIQYVARTDDEFKKLGSLGVTVLVSSGDDGAPAYYGSSGNCPIDSSTYCPLGGCNHTTTACGAITAYSTANNSYCYIPMALSTSEPCQLFIRDQNFTSALQSWAEANAACNIALENDVEANYNFYSSCSCGQLKAGTYNGYYFEAYTFNASNGAVFTAEYPTSSAYVTSVSATQFLWSSNKTVQSEVTASILTGATITTGGGFSTFQAMPTYQAAAVNSYLKSGTHLPPTFSYNASFRAYPDISFNGHNYLIFASTNADDFDSCPCVSNEINYARTLLTTIKEQAPVDGTSASAPSLAGMLALINNQLIYNNRSSIGFINPALYSLAYSDPKAFTDITSGSNRCNRAYCCEYGWNAAPGWDPVTGLGTPVFSHFLQFFMSTKPQMIKAPVSINSP